MLGWIFIIAIAAGLLWFAGSVSSGTGLLQSTKRVLFVLSIMGAVFVYLTGFLCETTEACKVITRLILSLLVFAVLMLIWMVDWRVKTNWWKVVLFIVVLFLFNPTYYFLFVATQNPSMAWSYVKHGFSWQRVADEENEKVRQEGLQYDAQLRKQYGIPENVSANTEHVTIPSGGIFRPLDATISEVGLFNAYDSYSPPELTKVFVLGDKVVFVKAYKIAGGRILIYDIPSQRIILENDPRVADYCITEAWFSKDVLSFACDLSRPGEGAFRPGADEVYNINLRTGNLEIKKITTQIFSIDLPAGWYSFEQQPSGGLYVMRLQSPDYQEDAVGGFVRVERGVEVAVSENKRLGGSLSDFEKGLNSEVVASVPIQKLTVAGQPAIRYYLAGAGDPVLNTVFFYNGAQYTIGLKVAEVQKIPQDFAPYFSQYKDIVSSFVFK